MATPGDRALLTARELGTWLDRDVGPALREETEAVAHGGTALTMLRLKASTKDVDFGFRAGEDFERFVAALKATGYRVTRDFRPNPRETYLRLERRAALVTPVVDDAHVVLYAHSLTSSRGAGLGYLFRAPPRRGLGDRCACGGAFPSAVPRKRLILRMSCPRRSDAHPRGSRQSETNLGLLQTAGRVVLSVNGRPVSDLEHKDPQHVLLDVQDYAVIADPQAAVRRVH